MRPDSLALLWEMSEAAAGISRFAIGKAIEDLSSDDMFRSAIYMKFVVIGEALAKLKTIDLKTYESISESWRIVGFRNQIVHGYAKLEDITTWQIIHNKLPILQRELASLLPK